ncbi:MAG: glycosyltransferase family 9 protein [Bacteroidota bacterium]
MDRKTNNILVIKLCCLGDIIQMTPALRGLRREYPQAEITLLISRWVEDLVKCIPFVDNYILYDAPYSTSIPRKVRETLALVRKLRKNSFDLIIIGHRNWLFGALALLSGTHTRVGFDGVPFLTHRAAFDPEVHEVERYLELVRSLDISVEEPKTELKPVSEDRESVDTLLERFGVARNAGLIGIFPGGGENPGTSMTIKRWYPDQYTRLVEILCREYNYAVALVGSKSDAELNEGIRGAVSESRRVFNLAGQLTLGQFIALAERCSLFVGGDSGPTHIAAAVGTPTLSLFGPSDPRLVAPRGRLHRYVWKQVHCSPCYTPLTVMNRKNFNGKDFVCWTGTHACMKNLVIDDVLQVIREMLGENARIGNSSEERMPKETQLKVIGDPNT